MAEAAKKKTPKLNPLGLERTAYEGKPSTLCGGCGHDSVTRAIVTAYFEMGVEPQQVAKMSGIGCSSKTTTYFLDRSHGFNGVHGRMPSMATGAHLANRSLQVVGVSGDGDTASIGMGQFVHAVRRNVDMVYVIENNGVYGLTKGQFSATADFGVKAKKAGTNPFPTIDCAGMAIQLGCGFVARTYSASQKQMVAIFKAAIAYRGFALVDVISPCVTFNPDMDGATKTYQWAKEHQIELNEVGYIPEKEELPAVDAQPGEVVDVELHDGSHLRLAHVEEDYDPKDRAGALQRIDAAVQKQEMLTGILHIDEDQADLATTLNVTQTPLKDLGPDKLRPGKDALKAVLDGFR